MKQVLVLGGGLAGLSAAYHLKDVESPLFEKEDEIGGICRSFVQDGFTFDVTGHLLHIKHDYTRDLIDTLLPGAMQLHDRRASIYSHDRQTPYPFQANTYGLPPTVVRDCLMGFIASLDAASAPPPENFRDWAVQTFGSGIANHFMLPFNEKFWKRDLRELTADWVSWAIPKPSLEEVVNGALGIVNEGMGYNPRFSYPRQGGIDCLPRALARQIGSIELSHGVKSIDTRRRVVSFTNGRSERYDFLICTLPLPMVFELLEDVPDKLVSDAQKLEVVSILDINLGIDRPNISDQHWLYFPEDKYVFTRIGFPMNFSENAVPPSTSSIYVEITYRPGSKPDLETAYGQSLEGLIDCGILKRDDRVLTRHVIDIPHAYVVFNKHRQARLPELIAYLDTQDIVMAGRYGDWDYYSMEDTILSGKRAAEQITTKLL